MVRFPCCLRGLLLLAPYLQAQVINTIGGGRYGTEVRIGRAGEKNFEWAMAIERFSVEDISGRTPRIHMEVCTKHPPLEAYRIIWIAVSAMGSTHVKWWNTVNGWSTTAKPTTQREPGKPWQASLLEVSVFGPCRGR